MNTKHTSHWLIDAALFTGLIAAFFLDLTGLELHQWLGAGIGVIALYHLVAHWQWVAAVTNRFFGRTSNKSRSYYLLNLAILAGFFIITFTGLVISSWLDLTLNQYGILAHDPHPRLDQHPDPGDLKDRPALALDRFSDAQSVQPVACPSRQPGTGAACPLWQRAAQPGRVLKVISFASAASFLALTQAVNSLSVTEAAAADTALATQAGSISTIERRQPGQRLGLFIEPVQRQPGLFPAL